MSILNIEHVKSVYYSSEFKNSLPSKKLYGFNKILATQGSQAITFINFLVENNETIALKELCGVYKEKSGVFFLKTVYSAYIQRGIKNVTQASLLATKELDVTHLNIFFASKPHILHKKHLRMNISFVAFALNETRSYMQYVEKNIRSVISLGLQNHNIFIRFMLTHNLEGLSAEGINLLDLYLRKMLVFFTEKKDGLQGKSHFNASACKEMVLGIFNQVPGIKKRLSGRIELSQFLTAYIDC